MMPFSAESIVQYAISAFIGYAGALTALYKVRRSFDLSIDKNKKTAEAALESARVANERLVDTEEDIDKRLKKLESGTIMVSSCENCKSGWKTQIEVYHSESEAKAQTIKELAALEMTNIKQQLGFMTTNQNEIKKTVEKTADAVNGILQSLAAMGRRFTDSKIGGWVPPNSEGGG
jgi:hypothetical protein